MRKFLIFTIFILIVLMPFVAKAGFGVSPPFIKNDRLTPGSYFEKTVYLIRGDPSEDMIVEVIVDTPEFKNWIIIDNEFVLPKGQQQFPVKIGINVPSNARYGVYQGYIRIRKKLEPGDNQTVLGVRIDITLTVMGEALSDFKIKGSSIPRLEEGNPLVILIVLENIGNTKIGLSKIHLDIYEVGHTKILKSGNITETESVEPFETKQISGEMQVDLEVGEYWADVSIYKDEETIRTFKVNFHVTSPVEVEEITEEERNLSFIKIIIFILLIIMR